MKTSLLLCAFLAAGPTVALAVNVGDTYASVIAEKGKPAGQIEAGNSQVLNYPDLTVKLKSGKVTATEAPLRVAALASTPASAPASTTKPKTAPGGQAVWGTNYQAALRQAKAESRRVFLFFTGSDWCVWCQRLQAEILTKPEFANFASEKLVLVELDFPKSKPQTHEVKAQNRELAGRFGIRGYPTVVVLDGTGKVLGQLGYQEGGPGPFLAKLATL